MEGLNGRGAIVTGAAAGIGLGIATVLAEEGARVAIADLDAGAAERAAEDLRASGHEAIAVGVDVTARASTEAMATTVEAAFGGIDILAANAGIYPLLELQSIDDAQWHRVMDVNAVGVLHSIQAVVPSMVRSGRGRIVITSSITGPLVGYPGFAHYGASKAAVLGLMRSAAIELAGRGVTINAVLPGNVMTPGLEAAGAEHQRKMLEAIPMGTFADPADIGWAVRFLASSEARYITGQSLVIDGGQVLPESPAALADLDH